ncbi:cold-shock protein [Tritonibacter mobilis]|uniref:cold-shock protein n=1 Tax=Tritonibacter mobilis TaxID=379347 RepID=UPI001CD9EE85|nr:cold shock domain-containing protein [Tritonibacter mobilis]MCA2007119.1 cold shock domain-containing protein [Tritonibacter mobilis]
MLLQSGPRTRTSVGFVKWFGGINKKTGKENEFGFIENIDGDDLFVHASQLGGAMPEEGNFAVFTVDGKDADKKKAVDVSICSNTETYKTEPLIEFLYDIDGFQKMIASREYRSVLSRLVNRSDNSWALDFLSDMLPISSSARFVVGKMIEDWDQQVQLLDQLSIPSITEADKFCDFVPSRYFDERHDKWIDWLKSISQSERDLFFEHKIEDLSLSFVLACAFEGIIDQTVQLGTHQERMADFATETFQNAFIAKRSGNVSVKLHEYVRTLYGQKFNGFDDFSRCSAISPHFELPKIKQKIINRDRSFVSDIARSEALRGHPEAFVLSKLLPLIWDGNNDLSVEAVFFHELWQAMLSDQLDIRHPGFMKLFPSCGTFGTDLSCEATYWSKGEHCYCRNKKCRDPQVLPDLQKSYLDYNVYDWLSYFGRNYATAQQPSRRDFPIKLAGYFNRVKELRRILNCRCCGTLMKPDFKYSRVEVKIYDEETGRYHSEPFSAAYRSTVFYCDSAGCTERGNKHYLNHCLGSKCSLIVDSRDLQKCSNGFYKCSCGSCCKEHQFEAEQRKRQLEQMIQDRGSRRFGR